MPNSNRYRQLTGRLTKLRKHFLPKVFSPTGVYSDRQLDFARAYRLLAHAEFESFVEDIVWGAAVKKVSSWKNQRKSSDLIVCFLSCYHTDWNNEVDEEVTAIQSPKEHIKAAKESAETVIDRAMNQFRSLVDKNHGVREASIKKIVIPVGVRWSELDQTWLNTVDTFGKLRGEVAHKAIGVQQQIDPQTEHQNVQILIVGFKTLDELIYRMQK